MRVRIQIEPLLGATVCVVTKISTQGGIQRHATKLYTLEGEFSEWDLVELLGQLQREIGETEA
jgi:hypothetical protein